MSLSPVVYRIGFVGIGYLIAAIVAVAITAFLLVVQSLLPDGGVSNLGKLRDWLIVVIGGLVITFLSALPGFLAALFLGFRYRWQGWRPYAIAGGIDVVPATLLFRLVLGPPLIPLNAFISSVVGGCAGGVAFWLIARRHLAGRPVRGAPWAAS